MRQKPWGSWCAGAMRVLGIFGMAFAPLVLQAEAAADVPFLLGVWTHQIGACTEIYEYRADGSFVGSSGDERLAGDFIAERVTGALAVAKVTRTIRSDNLGMDCLGSSATSVGFVREWYAVLYGSAQQMYLCLTASGMRCFGPLIRTVAPDSYGPDALMNWAERTYPQFFPTQEPNQWLPPYLYRYYPATGNYLGIAGDDVWVLGPVSGSALTRVGSLAEYRCQVQTCNTQAKRP